MFGDTSLRKMMEILYFGLFKIRINVNLIKINTEHFNDLATDL